MMLDIIDELLGDEELSNIMDIDMEVRIVLQSFGDM